VAIRRTVGDSEEVHEYNRCGALRGFGNAIVPQVAATFIQAAIAARGDVT
jgi:hypothetical protein